MHNETVQAYKKAAYVVANLKLTEPELVHRSAELDEREAVLAQREKDLEHLSQQFKVESTA
jgi:hypothetical protein